MSTPRSEPHGLPEENSSATTPELTDNSLPVDAPFYRTKPFNAQRVHTNTRRNLAYGALAVLVLFYAAIFIFLILDQIDMDQVVQLIAAFSGLQTLVAAAFGFYFAKDS